MRRSRFLSCLNTATERLFARWPFAFPWTIGSLVALVGYLWVFSLTTDMGGGRMVVSSLSNVVTAWALGLMVAGVLTRWIAGRGALVQLAANLALAVGFTLGWYVATVSLLAWRDGSLLSGARIAPFRGVAFVWQVFQGFALYGAAASLAYLSVALRRPVSATAPAAEPQRAARLLIRDGDEMTALEASDIILVTAADDYCEVSTATRRHLVRRSLGGLEAELPTCFLRVHRSVLVNLDRLIRAEPAGGGRLTLHLEAGLNAIASRTGARALRERSL